MAYKLYKIQADKRAEKNVFSDRLSTAEKDIIAINKIIEIHGEHFDVNDKNIDRACETASDANKHAMTAARFSIKNKS
jgi:hypothetical protein